MIYQAFELVPDDDRPTQTPKPVITIGSWREMRAKLKTSGYQILESNSELNGTPYRVVVGAELNSDRGHALKQTFFRLANNSKLPFSSREYYTEKDTER